MHTLSNTTVQQTLLHRHEQLIRRTKTRLIAVQIAGIEARIDQYQTQLKEQTDQMWQQHRTQAPDKAMSPTLTGLIDQRVAIAKKKLTVTHTFLVQNHIRSAYGRLESMHKSQEPHRRRIGFLTALVVDPRLGIATLLTDEQQQLLGRGPTYVTPCQMHLSPSVSSIDDLVKRQYAPLQHQMALLFSRYNIDISRQENIKYQIKKEFKDLFSRAIPDATLSRASDEKKWIRSIRARLKNNHWILRRTADYRNAFYLGPQQNFDQKCHEYMNQTDGYHVLFTIDEHNRCQVRQELVRKVHGLNSELEIMYKQKRLTKDVYENLRVNADKVSLPYLYFLPELSPVSVIIGLSYFTSSSSVCTRTTNSWSHP